MKRKFLTGLALAGLVAAAAVAQQQYDAGGKARVSVYGITGGTFLGIKADLDALVAGLLTPPFPVFQAWPSSTNITTATTTAAIVSGQGYVGSVCINTPVASGTVKIYDGLTAVNILATITTSSTITGIDPFCMPYNRALATGLTVVTTGAQDVTVTWKSVP